MERQEQRLVIGKSVRRVTLQRYLCCKIAHFPDHVKDRDLWALFQNQIFLQSKALREKDFSANFAISLELLAKILKEVNLSRGLTEGAILKLKTRILQELPDFTLPRRNYKHIDSLIGGSYHIIFSNPEGVLNRDLPPTRYIGVGYKDKGSARNEAEDASPGWQEIASSVSNLERKISETIEKLYGESSGQNKLKLAKLIKSFRDEIYRIQRRTRGTQKFAKADSY